MVVLRPTSVVIVDDHSMVADGLAALIRECDDLDVRGTASSVASGIALVERTHPDVVLMDYHLPDGDGGAATAAIKTRWPETVVIMLTGSGAQEALAKAIEAGCSGFLVKEVSGLDLAAAIRAAVRGEIVIHATSLQGALPSLAHRPHPIHDLTIREIEILQRLGRGASTQQLTTELFLSVHTVRNHVQNIVTKLGAHSRLEAVAIALREGIIEITQ
jgi:DNA-binding NarL/FixJ family response regulator